MRHQLWPEADPQELLAELHQCDAPIAFIAWQEEAAIGFIELSIRSYVEGAPANPAPFVEGIWIEPEHRRGGVAGALLRAGEAWAREAGHTFLGSDADLANHSSHAWHLASGFAEIERVVIFGKHLA